MNIKELTNIINDTYYSDSSSYKVIQSRQNNLLEFFGKRKNIKNINYQSTEEYKQWLVKKGYKDSSIAANMSYLSTVLKYAFKKGLIDKQITTPAIKIKARKDKFLTTEELKEMIDYCNKHELIELYQLIIIGINTGIRVSNIINILPEDIDNDYIRIYHNKTNHPYSIPLNKPLKELFKNYKPFTLNYRQLQYQFQKMLQDLKLSKDITIHTLRHTFASKLVENNIEPFVIMKLMNHQSINSTQRYLHIKNETLEKAINMVYY